LRYIVTIAIAVVVVFINTSVSF